MAVIVASIIVFVHVHHIHVHCVLIVSHVHFDSSQWENGIYLFELV